MNIAVLITCHNYRDYVVEAVESALAQTLAPAEIVVVDDGSTDGSDTLLRERLGSRPGVRIIRTENRGQLAAFVTALNASTAEIVAFLDADDRYRGTYLERLAGIYDRNPTVSQVFCNLERFGTTRGAWSPVRSDEDWGTSALRTWQQQLFFGLPTSANSMRRELARRVLMLPEEFHAEWRVRADDCLVFGGSLCGSHRYYVGEPLVEYRTHARNAWAHRTHSPVAVAQHSYRLLRLLDWYGRHAGLDPRSLQWAHLEFATKPKPRPGDFLSYLWLQWRAPMAPRLKLHALGLIIRHYVLSLW